MKKKIVKGIKIWIISFLCCVCAQIAVLCIGQQMIQENCGRSAKIFQETFLFQERISQIKHTTMDYYADCILINIIYEMDTAHPIHSVIKDMYYDRGEGYPNRDLMEAVSNRKKPNTSYGRYWHGSMVLLRPLLCFGDVSQIYTIYTFVIIGNLLGTGIWLVSGRQYRVFFCYCLSFLLTGGVWMTKCIEYANVALIMTIFVVLFLRAGCKEQIFHLCIVSGVVTCFMDFLTAETLTVTIPLCCLWALDDEKKPAGWKDDKQNIITALLLWGTAYGMMFWAKWSMLSLFQSGGNGENIMERMHMRTQGNVFSSLFRNIWMLFPIEDSAPILVQAVLVAGFLLLLTKSLLNRNTDRKKRTGAVILALVPYIHFVVLREHSILHCFFTYRQQMATLFVMLYVLTEIRWKKIQWRRSE